MYILDQVFEALRTAWEAKNVYYVRSGLIFWGQFDFQSYPKAISIQVDQGSLLTLSSQVGKELNLSFEIFGTVQDYVSGEYAIDNTMISHFLSDAEDIIRGLYKHRTNDGNRLFVEVDEKTASFRTTYDANLSVQGVIITFTVKI